MVAFEILPALGLPQSLCQMTRFPLVLLSLGALGGVGCAHKSAPFPPAQTLTLDNLRATYRDYGRSSVCEVDPEALAAETQGMNQTLGGFLLRTGQSAAQPWTDEQIVVLELATEQLPPALSAHERVLESAERCRFPVKYGLEDILQQGARLVRESHARLTEAPALLRQLKSRQTLDVWRQTQVRQRATAREQWCPVRLKPGRMADVYYASEDETGRTEWLFCDGVRVLKLGDGKTDVVLPPERASKKPPTAAHYLGAVSKYPAEEVQHAPKTSGRSASGG